MGQAEVPAAVAETSSTLALIYCYRGTLEFEEPVADAAIEVWTLGRTGEEGEVEARLFSEGKGDAEGNASCMVPTDQGFEIRARAREEAVTQLIEEKRATNFDQYFRGTIRVRFPQQQATIALSGRVRGADSDVYFSAHAGAEVMPQAIAAYQSRFSERCAAKAPEYRFEANINVPAGFPIHLALYAPEGKQITTLFSGRALQADEVWECELEIDWSEFYRPYFFRLAGDEGVDLRNTFGGGFQLSLFDPETKFLQRGSMLQHEVGKVYEVLVLSGRPNIARFKHTQLGAAEWLIQDGAGESEQTAELIQIKPPVRILVPSIDAEAVLAQLPQKVEVSYPLAMPEGKKLVKLADQDFYEISGPLSTAIQGLRLGDRLFRCAMTAAGDYRLGDPQLIEIPLTELAQLDLRMKTDFPQEDRILIEIQYQGLHWEYIGLQSFGSREVRHAVQIPVGLTTVTARYGSSKDVQTRKIEVGVNGAQLTIDLRK